MLERERGEERESGKERERGEERERERERVGLKGKCSYLFTRGNRAEAFGRLRRTASGSNKLVVVAPKLETPGVRRASQDMLV